ncbi:hypothetical protein SAMN05216223_118129 [Actinacidiphila yanglinensis]|uniref:Uncharacterized protein n=1 Tax=Actinacidiphila yanglinensis TaxID=310779 RepID=A0A1H6DQP4_9ACTN|nr:hypothetical protein SAMN05216223_118129 [Actinacidiphila yanglinensis]
MGGGGGARGCGGGRGPSVRVGLGRLGGGWWRGFFSRFVAWGAHVPCGPGWCGGVLCSGLLVVSFLWPPRVSFCAVAGRVAPVGGAFACWRGVRGAGGVFSLACGSGGCGACRVGGVQGGGGSWRGGCAAVRGFVVGLVLVAALSLGWGWRVGSWGGAWRGRGALGSSVVRGVGGPAVVVVAVGVGVVGAGGGAGRGCGCRGRSGVWGWRGVVLPCVAAFGFSVFSCGVEGSDRVGVAWGGLRCFFQFVGVSRGVVLCLVGRVVVSVAWLLEPGGVLVGWPVPVGRALGVGVVVGGFGAGGRGRLCGVWWGGSGGGCFWGRGLVAVGVFLGLALGGSGLGGACAAGRVAVLFLCCGVRGRCAFGVGSVRVGWVAFLGVGGGAVRFVGGFLFCAVGAWGVVPRGGRWGCAAGVVGAAGAGWGVRCLVAVLFEGDSAVVCRDCVGCFRVVVAFVCRGCGRELGRWAGGGRGPVEVVSGYVVAGFVLVGRCDGGVLVRVGVRFRVVLLPWVCGVGWGGSGRGCGLGVVAGWVGAGAVDVVVGAVLGAAGRVVVGGGQVGAADRLGGVRRERAGGVGVEAVVGAVGVAVAGRVEGGVAVRVGGLGGGRRVGWVGVACCGRGGPAVRVVLAGGGGVVAGGVVGVGVAGVLVGLVLGVGVVVPEVAVLLGVVPAGHPVLVGGVVVVGVGGAAGALLVAAAGAVVVGLGVVGGVAGGPVVVGGGVVEGLLRLSVVVGVGVVVGLRERVGGVQGGGGQGGGGRRRVAVGGPDRGVGGGCGRAGCLFAPVGVGGSVGGGLAVGLLAVCRSWVRSVAGLCGVCGVSRFAVGSPAVAALLVGVSGSWLGWAGCGGFGVLAAGGAVAWCCRPVVSLGGFFLGCLVVSSAAAVRLSAPLCSVMVSLLSGLLGLWLGARRRPVRALGGCVSLLLGSLFLVSPGPSPAWSSSRVWGRCSARRSCWLSRSRCSSALVSDPLVSSCFSGWARGLSRLSWLCSSPRACCLFVGGVCSGCSSWPVGL